ncbi:hypothetical protein Ndes2526B_g08714 [Nannochloris sp. 'desiccata']
MRPPLSHRVRLGGGLIPLPGDSNKAQVGPLRASMAADAPSLEKQEPSKGENGTSWFPNISMSQIFDFFLKFAVSLACAGVLMFMCNLWLTHYQSVYQFLYGSASGNVITGVSAVVGFAAKLVYDKVETFQSENTKRLDKMEAETTKRFDKLELILSPLTKDMAVMQNNIAWIRGDYGVVNRGHRPSNEVIKPPTDEPLEDEDSSAGTNP